MELRHLRVFAAVAGELHFGRAAKRLHVSQSAVSQTIKDLEADVGAALLARDKRNVALTAAGAALLSSSAQALAILERGAAEARRAAAGETGRLAVRYVLGSTLTVFPRALAAFTRACPEVAVEVQRGATADNLDALARGFADVVFTPLRKGPQQPFAHVTIEKSNVALLVPRRHPLSRKRAASLADVAGAPLILLRSEGEVRAHLRRAFAAAGVEPVIAAEVDDLEALLAFVGAGVGVSIAPALRFPHARVVAVPLRPALPAGISAVWSAERLSPPAARFLAILRAASGV